MAAQKFLVRKAGRTQQEQSTVASTGAADAGSVVALDADGRLNASALPAGIGADTQILPASEALIAGNFVNIFADAGVAKVRLADNSNGRVADGYVLASVASSADATVYPLDGTNNGLVGLDAGGSYWLGVAGGTIATPLVETDQANTNKISQLAKHLRHFKMLIWHCVPD
jgi:hypothetical protein